MNKYFKALLAQQDNFHLNWQKKHIALSGLILSLLFSSNISFAATARTAKSVDVPKIELEPQTIQVAPTSITPLESSVQETNAFMNLTNNVTSALKGKEFPEDLPGYLDIIKPGGMQIDKGIIKSVKFGVLYSGELTLDKPEDANLSSRYANPCTELSVLTKFRDDKTSFKMSYFFTRRLKEHESQFFEGLSEIHVDRKIGEHNSIQIGQGSRLPIGVEGAVGTYGQDMALRAMIGRNFGNTRSLGLRWNGKYDVVDYDIGIYDSTRYMQDFFQGVDFTGWVNVRPLAKIKDNKYGKVTLGTGVNVGKYLDDYRVWGGYVGYDYKRFHNKFEYAYADGYNGSKNSDSKANGLYDTVIFDITPKLSLLARYDWFRPDMDKNYNAQQEYSVGATYKVSKHMKILANYVYRKLENDSDANLFMLVTRIMF